MTHLRFQDATIETGGRRAQAGPLLGPVDLEVAAGETLVLFGPSGAGKSLLIELAAGLRTPSRGSVRLGNEPVASIRPDRRGVGLLTQDAALYDHLDVRDNVGFGLPRGSAHRDARIESAAGVASCRDLLAGRTPASRLSGGERRRVALAKALAPEHRLLLLDEPFEGLDATTRARVRIDLAAALRERAEAVRIIAVHDRGDAIALGDRILLLDRGRVLQVGTADDLLEHPVSSRVLRVFSDVPPACLPARLEGPGLHVPGGTIERPADAPPPTSDGSFELVVRAGAVRVVTEGGLEGWRVLAEERTATGRELVLEHPEASGPEGLLRLVAAPGSAAPAPGAVVRITLDPAGTRLFARR